MIDNDVEPLAINLEVLHPLDDHVQQDGEFVIVPVRVQEDPVRLLIERVTQAGQVGVVRVLVQAVAHEFGEHARTDRSDRARIDFRSAGRKHSSSQLCSKKKKGRERERTRDLKRKKQAALGTHQRSSFLYHNLIVGVFSRLRGLRAGTSTGSAGFCLISRSRGTNWFGSGRASPGKSFAVNCDWKEREKKSQITKKTPVDTREGTHVEDFVRSLFDAVLSPVPFLLFTVRPLSDLFLTRDEQPTLVGRHQLEEAVDLVRVPLCREPRRRQEFRARVRFRH